MKSLPLFTILLLFTSATPGQIKAQGTARPDSVIDPYQIEGVLVEVSRTGQDLARIPQSISVVTGPEIQFAQRQVTIDEALQGIPGVFASSRNNFTLGGGVRLNIRAPLSRFGIRGIQLLQDGIPLTMADGTTQTNNLDLGSAGRMEVIRGPSSVLWGNAAGGVVSVTTQFPSDSPLLVTPEAQFGSHGYNRQQVKAEGTVGDFGYVVNLNRMETDGFRQLGAADIRRANVVARAFLSERTLLRMVFNLYDMPFAENASSLTRDDARNDPTSVRQLAIDQGWGESVTQAQGALALEHDIEGGHKVRVLGWGVTRDLRNPIPFSIIDVQRTAAGLRSEYQGGADLGSMSLDWTVGFDVSYMHDDRTEFGNAGVAVPGERTQEGDLEIDQLETVLSLGPFVQTTLRLHPDFGITAGVRYDRYDFEVSDRFLSDGNQTGDRRLSAGSPMVGLTYTPKPTVSFFGNYATAYETPTTVELSNRPDGLGGFNPELDPAKLRSFEVGVRGALPEARVRYEVTGYMSTVTDALTRYVGNDEQTLFRNAGETSRDGFELALEWAPVADLHARLAYTYQDFVFVRFEPDGNDFSGNTEPGVPPHSFFAGLTHVASFGLTSAVDVRWVDRYPVNDANTFSNWSYKVVNLRFGLDVDWNHANVRPFVGIDNLFDEQYNSSSWLNARGSRYYEPAPGRTIYLGLGVGGGF